MAAPIKMDELLVSWLGSDDVYENVLNLIEKYDKEGKAGSNSSEGGQENNPANSNTATSFPSNAYETKGKKEPIPPFYPLKTSTGITVRRRRKLPRTLLPAALPQRRL